MNRSQSCEKIVSILLLPWQKPDMSVSGLFDCSCMGHFQPDVGSFKQIQPPPSTYIPFVAYDCAVAVIQLHILQEMDVMDTCLSKVKDFRQLACICLEILLILQISCSYDILSIKR